MNAYVVYKAEWQQAIWIPCQTNNLLIVKLHWMIDTENNTPVN